jgi:tetratricopeptide (TPR) repeat protein
MSGKTDEFLEKLAPCIEKGDLEACVEEASRLAEEMKISGEELLELSCKSSGEGINDFAYVLALAAAPVLKEDQQAIAYLNAGHAAYSLGNHEKCEMQYKKAIEIDPLVIG